MTDNDIIKALGDISYGGHSCTKCKYKITKGEERCGLKGCKIARNALDLINRQKAKIEELYKENARQRAEIEKLAHCCDDCAGCTEWICDCSNIRAEPITELVDRFKNVVVSKYEYTDVRVFKDLDQIAKEMKEGATDTNVGCKEKGEQ